MLVGLTNATLLYSRRRASTRANYRAPVVTSDVHWMEEYVSPESLDEVAPEPLPAPGRCLLCGVIPGYKVPYPYYCEVCFPPRKEPPPRKEEPRQEDDSLPGSSWMKYYVWA